MQGKRKEDMFRTRKEPDATSEELKAEIIRLRKRIERLEVRLDKADAKIEGIDKSFPKRIDEHMKNKLYRTTLLLRDESLANLIISPQKDMGEEKSTNAGKVDKPRG